MNKEIFLSELYEILELSIVEVDASKFRWSTWNREVAILADKLFATGGYDPESKDNRP